MAKTPVFLKEETTCFTKESDSQDEKGPQRSFVRTLPSPAATTIKRNVQMKPDTVKLKRK